MWLDIASIVFICVTANHLGLISAIEGVLGRKLVVVNCCKCFSFWGTFVYGCYDMATNGTLGLIGVLAVSFLASYAAIWLELLEGMIDILYNKVYDKVYSAEDKTSD